MSMRKVSIDEPMHKLFGLSKYLSIPLNQRSYEWEQKEVDEYLNDIYQSWIDDTDYCTGMFIVLVESSTTFSLWDGQQRTITYMLTLIKLLNKLKRMDDTYIEFYNDHIKRLSVPKYDMTQKEQILTKNNNWQYISKVCYCSETEEDNDMLTNLLHDRVLVVEDLVSEGDSDKKYKCNFCKDTTITRLDDAKRHLLRRCKKITEEDKMHLDKYKDVSNNILNAMKTIARMINSWKLTSDNLVNLIKFMHDRVHCDIEVCTDVKSAAQMFEFLNNRGRPVSLLTIAKSKYLSKAINDEHKYQVARYFQDLSSLATDYKCLGLEDKNIFEAEMRVCLKAFSLKKLTLSDLLQDSLGKDELFQELVTIHERFRKLCMKLASDEYKYAHKVLKSDTILTLVVPLCYKFGEDSLQNVINIVLSHLVRVKLLVKRHARYTWFEYLNAFNGILAKAYNNDITFHEACREIQDVIWTKSVVQHGTVDYSQFAKLIKELPLTIKNNKDVTKFILLYYIAHTKTNVIKVDVSEADLEHIGSKSGFEKSDPEQNRLGNCTILESRNTGNHKGNRSIQNKAFREKLESYKESNLKINNVIFKEFSSCDVFDSSCIAKREELLCRELFDITEKFLKPLNKE